MSKLNEKELLKELDKAVGFKVAAYKQIRELIKIFFAKEISAGPIKKDISRPDLVQWLQGINQAATAVKDYYVIKATTQLIVVLKTQKIQEYLNGIEACIALTRKLKEKQGIGKNWLPTAENINALPEPVRDYIAGLQTNADPPSMVADNIIMKDTIKTLEKMLEERPAVDEGFVNIWAKEFQSDTPADSSLNERLVKKLLREAGVEVIKK